MLHVESFEVGVQPQSFELRQSQIFEVVRNVVVFQLLRRGKPVKLSELDPVLLEVGCDTFARNALVHEQVDLFGRRVFNAQRGANYRKLLVQLVGPTEILGLEGPQVLFGLLGDWNYLVRKSKRSFRIVEHKVNIYKLSAVNHF